MTSNLNAIKKGVHSNALFYFINISYYGLTTSAFLAVLPSAKCFPLRKSYTEGAAKIIDEYVPTITPTKIANENPRITSPPKINNTARTNTIVNDVMIVLLKVELIAWFTTRQDLHYVHLVSIRIHVNGQIQPLYHSPSRQLQLISLPQSVGQYPMRMVRYHPKLRIIPIK